MGATALLLDGHWAGAGDWGGLLFVPSVDELQEFKVQTSTFSPQYGWSMGNAVNAVTKSGTPLFMAGCSSLCGTVISMPTTGFPTGTLWNVRSLNVISLVSTLAGPYGYRDCTNSVIGPLCSVPTKACGSRHPCPSR